MSASRAAKDINPSHNKCQGGELNSRPRAYESPALTLSYPGKISISEEAKSKTVEPGFKSLCWSPIGRTKMFAHLSARHATKSSMQIGLIHYTSWPTVGGVEVVLREQAGLMAKAGHEVVVICGSGRSFNQQIRTMVLPDLNISSLSVTAAQAEVWNGYPAAGYFALVQKLRDQLAPALGKLDC